MNSEAANRVSQRLAHSSTPRYADGLNFRVRDGYGCHPTALAASTPTHGLEPWYANVGTPRVNTIQLTPGLAQSESAQNPQMNGGSSD